jgi:acyl carrier protein
MAMTEERLIGYLRAELALGDGLDPDSELFSNGALDSVAMLNLIAFVEEVCGIDVRPEDVTLANFDTPARIVLFSQAQQ